MAPRGEISGHVFNVDLSYTSTCVGLDILEVIFNWIKGTFACFFFTKEVSQNPNEILLLHQESVVENQHSQKSSSYF